MGRKTVKLRSSFRGTCRKCGVKVYNYEAEIGECFWGYTVSKALLCELRARNRTERRVNRVAVRALKRMAKDKDILASETLAEIRLIRRRSK